MQMPACNEDGFLLRAAPWAAGTVRAGAAARSEPRRPRGPWDTAQRGSRSSHLFKVEFADILWYWILFLLTFYAEITE